MWDELLGPSSETFLWFYQTHTEVQYNQTVFDPLLLFVCCVKSHSLIIIFLFRRWRFLEESLKEQEREATLNSNI